MNWWSNCETMIRMMIESLPEDIHPVGQKKIYEWIYHIFIFIPDEQWSLYLNETLLQFPVQQYYQSKTSMFEWSYMYVNYIRNAMKLKPYTWNMWRDYFHSSKKKVHIKPYILGSFIGFLLSYLILNKIKQ